ncbi:MAG: hydroxymethylbilane synthase [Longimicrobiales bacterium]
MTELRLGTRGSALALWQTRRVAADLAAFVQDRAIVERIIRTRGDDDRDAPLPEIGGKGVFTDELERALLGGEVDLAVHSLKDLPIEPRAGLAIAAVCVRDDARDAMVSRIGESLHALRAGAVVGTSSTRRTAQLLCVRPDLDVRPIRGNVETRIAKVDAGDYDATVLAAAGLLRLGLEGRVADWLPLETFLPAPGQGALAVQCRADDAAVLRLLSNLDDADARRCTVAERSFLAGLGGGCSLPVAAYATIDHDSIHLRGFVGALNGRRTIRLEQRASLDAGRAAGLAMAERALLDGAAELLG